MSPERRLALARLLALLAVIAISLYVYSIRDQAQELAKYGYVGIFLFAALANATVLLPAPGVLVVFAMGAIFNPFWVAIAAGAGAAVGELTGYLAGFSGQGIIEKSERYERLKNWMEINPRLRDLAILVMAAIPNPFFDLAGLAAGALRIPVLRFLLFCAAGSTLKMFIFAYAGSSSLDWMFGG
jgi:uncharacterized membrane protein YdjX (TVP38/TMEM64 family)